MHASIGYCLTGSNTVRNSDGCLLVNFKASRSQPYRYKTIALKGPFVCLFSIYFSALIFFLFNPLEYSNIKYCQHRLYRCLIESWMTFRLLGSNSYLKLKTVVCNLKGVGTESFNHTCFHALSNAINCPPFCVPYV